MSPAGATLIIIVRVTVSFLTLLKQAGRSLFQALHPSGKKNYWEDFLLLSLAF
jgi:hypothetical protein